MGRPSFKPTDEQRAQVNQWVKARVAIEEMARRLELAPKTFRKHFAAELGLTPVETVKTQSAQPTRAEYRPSEDERMSAFLLAGFGIAHSEIARLLTAGDVDVLKEHFADELKSGPIKLKDHALKDLYFQMRGGSVGATKAVITLIAAGEAAPDPDQQPAAQGLLGKKEQAKLAARGAEAGTPWESILGPSSKPN